MTIARAWIFLIVASAATTALAYADARGLAFAVVLLGLALAKAWVILSTYLGLSRAPQIRQGCMDVLLLWAAIALALVAL